MNFYILTEPELTENFWNHKYLSGIKSAVREAKGNLVDLNLQDITDFQNKSPVIVNGRNPEWISTNTKRLVDKGFHPILLATNNNTGLRGVSSLTFDFYGIFTGWCAHFYNLGLKNMALLGVRPDNMSDSFKQRAFVDFNNGYNAGSNTHVYSVTTSLKQCCEEFISNIDKHDVVLCTSDLVSIILLSLLRKTPNNKKLIVHSFWDSPLAEYLNPEIKMHSLDYHELGRQAIRLYTFLSNNKSIQSISATVSGVPYLNSELKVPQKAKVDNSFMQEESAKDVYVLEKLFSTLDSIDLKIIKGILSKTNYEQIAEAENVSVGTVKYRVKKMLTLTKKGSRKEFLLLISKYLGTNCFN